MPTVVSLHLRAFSGFFLTKLGPRFLAEFYRSFLNQSVGLAFVAEDATGKAIGVVAGPMQPCGFFGRLLRRRWWAFGLAALHAALRNPAMIPRLFRALKYRGGQPAGPTRALLSSIAVAPETQGFGVGRQLVLTWLRAVQDRGASGCYLTTDADGNDRINRFYQDLGWELSDTYVTAEGRRMNRYVLDFPAAPASAQPIRRAA